MKSLFIAWLMILTGAGLFAADGVGNTKAGSEDNIICKKEFKIVSPRDEKKLGHYELLAIQKKGPGEKIHITETVSIDRRGKKVGYVSSVIYNSDSPLKPESGSVETNVDGKVCMKGTVTFKEKSYSLECTGFLNKRTGVAIDPVKKFEKKDEPIAEGVLIFQSALPSIGPRMLSKEGELKDIVFVEFPDDLGAPELIHFKKGYRLVRGKADEKGEYNLSIYSPHSDDSISSIRYNKNDQVMLISNFGKLKLQEIKEVEVKEQD